MTSFFYVYDVILEVFYVYDIILVKNVQSLLCEPVTGKFLDFSGPREVCPFPGDDFPLLMDVRIQANEQQREMASNFITDFILDKVKALEVDIQVIILTYDVIKPILGRN